MTTSFPSLLSFLCFFFFSGVADDGKPPWLVIISLFFFSSVVDDGEPKGSLSSTTLEEGEKKRC
jgi:hypothetical protein